MRESLFHQGLYQVTVFRHESCEVDRVGAMLLHGHGMVPPQDMGLTNIPHTMTSEFAHKSVHYLSRDKQSERAIVGIAVEAADSSQVKPLSFVVKKQRLSSGYCILHLLPRYWIPSDSGT